jgi:hypothetical protein
LENKEMGGFEMVYGLGSALRVTLA